MGNGKAQAEQNNANHTPEGPVAIQPATLNADVIGTPGKATRPNARYWQHTVGNQALSRVATLGIDVTSPYNNQLARTSLQRLIGQGASALEPTTQSRQRNYALQENTVHRNTFTTSQPVFFRQDDHSGDAVAKEVHGPRLTRVVQRNKLSTPTVQRDFKDQLALVLGPSFMVQKAAIELLELLPKEERDQEIRKILTGSISLLKAVREPPEALTKAISQVMPGVPIDPMTLWPLMVSGVIGYFEHINTLSGDELVQKAKKSIEAQADPNFYVGAILGMIKGIGQWFLDIGELIKLLAEFSAYTAFPPLFIYEYSDEIKKAWEAVGVLSKWISDNKDALFELLSDKQALLALKTIAKEALYTIAEGLGKKAAQEIIKTIDAGAFAMGEAGGKMIGYFIPDILLAVGTDGISELLKGVQVVIKSIRASVLSIEEVARVISVIGKAIDGMKGMKIFAKGSKLGELGAKFVELLENLMKVFKGFKGSHDDLVKKIIEIAKKKGMPIDATVDKLYNIGNLEKGLIDANFLKSKSFRETIKILLDPSHADWKKAYQSITYAAGKGRFAEFDVIFQAIVKGKFRAFPRGFTSAEHFAEFSKEMGSVLKKYGADVRIQGSSTMELKGPLKDIDIAIFANEAEFIKTMKTIWTKQFAQYYKLAKVPEAAAIDTKTFLNFLSEAEKVGQGKVAANGVEITGEMRSAWLAWKNGKIFDSKFMTTADKAIRKAWTTKLGLETIDISLILKGKSFDVGPFIPIR